jgi:hypothetical protein
MLLPVEDPDCKPDLGSFFYCSTYCYTDVGDANTSHVANGLEFVVLCAGSENTRFRAQEQRLHRQDTAD